MIWPHEMFILIKFFFSIFLFWLIMKQHLKLALAGAALALTCTATQAEIYHFSQGGFASGSVVSGFFYGHDSNNDGILNSYEVGDYNFAVHGGTYDGVVFEYFYRRPLAITYHLGSGSIGSVAGDFFSAYSGVQIGFDANHTGGAIYDGFHQIPTDHTSQLIVLAPVPEPESYAMLLGGLMAVAWVAKRRKAAA